MIGYMRHQQLLWEAEEIYKEIESEFLQLSDRDLLDLCTGKRELDLEEIFLAFAIYRKRGEKMESLYEIHLTMQEIKTLKMILAEKLENILYAKLQYMKDQPELREICESILEHLPGEQDAQ